LKNITDLNASQVRIFPVDIVPLSLITTKSSVEKIKDELSISEIEVRPFLEGKDIFIFRRGELRIDSKLVIINKIEVDHRRIIVDIDGTSEQANKVYESFLVAIAGVSNSDLGALRVPILLAEMTQCVLTLDFSFEALFNSAFVTFLKQKVKKEASSSLAMASVRPFAAAAEITYDIVDNILIDNKITMSPKQFSITPRPGAPLNARKFVVSSPFDSDTHLKLIKELNKIIAGTD
jgi:hypothetical protein